MPAKQLEELSRDFFGHSVLEPVQLGLRACVRERERDARGFMLLVLNCFLYNEIAHFSWRTTKGKTLAFKDTKLI